MLEELLAKVGTGQIVLHVHDGVIMKADATLKAVEMRPRLPRVYERV